MEPVPLSKLAMQSKSAQTSGAGSVMRPPRRRSCSRTVGRRSARDGATVVRGGRADVVGRCVVAATGAVVGGRVVAGRAVAGGSWWSGRRCGSRRRGRGGARGGCRQRSRVGGRGRWPGDQPYQDEQRHQRQSRYRGDELLPAVPGAAGAGRGGGGGAPSATALVAAGPAGGPSRAGSPIGRAWRAYLRREAGVDVITGVSDSRIVTSQR
jgi:hypothetical protein